MALENVAVTNGLFTVALDFGGGVFNGSARWLEIGVRPGAATNAFTTLAPRQAVTSTPYAMRAANVSGQVPASQITGTLSSAHIAPGSITPAMLAPQAAVNNLAASGGLLLSGFDNPALTTAGFVRIGTVRSQDNWQQLYGNSAPAPSPCSRHTAVWTGSELIVWGGIYLNAFNDGARYNPASNTWTPLSTSGAPTGRFDHPAVWTGQRMIIWGGRTGANNPGGLYDPATDSWQPVSLTDAPVQRFFHSCVWTGSEMLVWGGARLGGPKVGLDWVAGGGRYNPVSDTWNPLASAGAPFSRFGHTTVWTGSEMIVFAGSARDGLRLTTLGNVNDGARYRPATDSWEPLPLAEAPEARFGASGIWTGTEMIVWGGTNQVASVMGSGGRYFPGENAWMPLSAGPVSAGHSAVWTGSRMLLFGGSDGGRLQSRLWSYLPTPPLVLYQKP